MAIRKDYHRDGDVLSCMWQGIGDIAHIFANFTVESISKRSKGADYQQVCRYELFAHFIFVPF
jgi:hypothetical protein